MRKMMLLSFCIAILSCKKDKGTNNGGTTDTANVKDVQAAKNYYNSVGAQFQFRAAHEMGLAADGKNSNHTMLEVYAIIENGGKKSILFTTTLPVISLQGAGAFVNCQGDFLSSTSTASLGFNSGYAQKGEADILPNNDLVMYVYDELYRGSASAPYGNIGNQGGFYNNITQKQPQNAVTPNGSWGYMYILNNQTYYFSLWGTAYPALHTYNTISKTWSNQKVTAMDGTYKNFVASQDVAKVGNSDRIYWAYLSFKNDFNIDGQLNILSFNGNTLSAPKSLTIGNIGEGSNGSRVYKHSIMLCKNGTNVQQPYLVVRHYNTDILDIYKFNGNELELIKQGVLIPDGVAVSGNLKQYKNIVVANGNIFLFALESSTGQYKIFKLSGSQFEPVYANLLKTNERFTAIEAAANGLLVSVCKTIPTKPEPMEVSDIILIPN